MDVKDAAMVLTILDTTLRILERQEAIRKAYQAIRDDIKGMVDENRNPTDAEWAAINARLAAAEGILESRAEEARALLDAEPADPLGR